MSDHHAKTRGIYQKQHERISADTSATGRIQGMYENNTFGLNPAWFEGKKGLDAGCGNIGSLIIALDRLKMSEVHGIDIGTEWIPALKQNLEKAGLAESQYHLRTGSVLEMPYPDGFFDFVAINGVLVHLQNLDEVRRGFDEGARLCRSGGYYFTSYGPCGGVMQGVIFPALREHYRKDAAFKDFIDHINPEDIHSEIDQLVEDGKKHTGENLDARFLKSLFGVDYCVFLQNYLQAPTWLTNETTPEFVENLYAERGFTDVLRLSKYVKRSDVRKYFAPLHYDRDGKLSRILYGKGYVTYIARKN